MRALLLAAVFLSSALPCYSFSLLDDLKANLRLTVGQGVIPAYYGNYATGQSKAVGLTSVFAYRYVHAVAGVAHTFQKEDKGEGVAGGLFRVDQLIGKHFPWLRNVLHQMVPEESHAFLDRFYFGYSLSWDFDRGRPGHGIISGVEIKF